ncbi:MAG: hypothetical protein J6P05_06095 [Lachnospiraceae bacterium]|nr:hypothetical protein [Lachnospiraceae bacterium]
MNKKYLKTVLLISIIAIALLICFAIFSRKNSPDDSAADTASSISSDHTPSSDSAFSSNEYSQSISQDEYHMDPDDITPNEFFSICNNYARALVSGNIVIPETIYTNVRFNGHTLSGNAVFSVSSWDLEGDTLVLNTNVRFPCSIKMERMENGEIGYSIENLGSVLDMDMSNLNEYEHLIWMVYLREANNFTIQRKLVIKEYAEENNLDIKGFSVDGEFTHLDS